MILRLNKAHAFVHKEIHLIIRLDGEKGKNVFLGNEENEYDSLQENTVKAMASH